MKKIPSRPVLDEEQIKRCHDIVDDLVRLHRETDPVSGSEDDKTEKAYQAINQVGMLSAILTEWAEGHILGCYHHVAKSKDEWIDDAASDSHINEGMWYLDEYNEALFVDKKYVECLRTGLAAIIRNSFRRSGTTAWRMLLSESLQALNDGQVDWLLTPTKTNLQGNAYILSNLKWAAVLHVHRLMGEGWKKTAAQQEVAESCGITFEAIKKWERQGIKERDKNKVALQGMRRGSVAIDIARKQPDHNEEEFLTFAANRCITPHDGTSQDKELKDFFCDITICYRLCQEEPLDTMKERLIDAGMRNPT